MPRRIKKINNKNEAINKKQAKDKIRPKKVNLKVKIVKSKGNYYKTGSRTQEKTIAAGNKEIQRIQDKEAPKSVLAKEKSSRDVAKISRPAGEKEINQVYNEKIEQEKKLLMWSGIIFFMLLILVGWVYNFNSQVKKNSKNINNNANKLEWSKITGEVSDSIKQIEADLAKLREAKLEKVGGIATSTDFPLPNLLKTEQTTATSSEQTATSPELNIEIKNTEGQTENNQISAEEINKLKKNYSRK